MSPEARPLLVRLSTRDLVVGAIRLAAAAVVLLPAALIDSPGAALRQAALGARSLWFSVRGPAGASIATAGGCSSRTRPARLYVTSAD